MPFAIRIDRRILDGLIAHARRDYPNECCGILVGRRDENETAVHGARGAENISDSDRTRSFQVDWQALFAAMRSVRDGGEAIVGFYHSHPDGSVVPSVRDTRLAWTDHSYVIIGINGGSCRGVASWRVGHFGAGFTEELIVEC